jgi:hypothetical protein
MSLFLYLFKTSSSASKSGKSKAGGTKASTGTSAKSSKSKGSKSAPWGKSDKASKSEKTSNSGKSSKTSLINDVDEGESPCYENAAEDESLCYEYVDENGVPCSWGGTIFPAWSPAWIPTLSSKGSKSEADAWDTSAKGSKKSSKSKGSKSEPEPGGSKASTSSNGSDVVEDVGQITPNIFDIPEASTEASPTQSPAQLLSEPEKSIKFTSKVGRC